MSALDLGCDLCPRFAACDKILSFFPQIWDSEVSFLSFLAGSESQPYEFVWICRKSGFESF